MRLDEVREEVLELLSPEQQKGQQKPEGTAESGRKPGQQRDTANINPAAGAGNPNEQSKTPALDAFGRDLPSLRAKGNSIR